MQAVGYTVHTPYRLAPVKGVYRDIEAKYNILYGRLSRRMMSGRGRQAEESNSIHNQKLFLEQYAADHGFENTLFLADDSYSGTNVRPGRKS